MFKSVKCFTNSNLNSKTKNLRQLSVSSSEATQTLLEERVDLCFLYRCGQIHGIQRTGILIAACSREGESNHGRLLPLGQVVHKGEPHRSVLKG